MRSHRRSASAQGTSGRLRLLLARDDQQPPRLFFIGYHGPGATHDMANVSHGPERTGLETWSVEHPRLRSRDDCAQALPRAGFRELAFCGAYDRSPLRSCEASRSHSAGEIHGTLAA